MIRYASTGACEIPPPEMTISLAAEKYSSRAKGFSAPLRLNSEPSENLPPMKRTILLSAVFALCIAACERRGCDDMPNPETGSGGGDFGSRLECSGVVCTASWDMINVDIVDAGGAPVNLDSLAVTNAAGAPVPLSNGQRVWGNPYNGNGRYTVLNDGWVSGHEGLGSHFYAKGFRNGQMVFNEVYKISADCCHISKLSGKDRIIVP